MTIKEFQTQIERLYYERDEARGVDKTFLWFVEEVGELAREVKKRQDPQRLKEEIADVLAWLSTVASLLDIDLETAAAIYAEGCPKCHQTPCDC